jgi:hypothetical protein
LETDPPDVATASEDAALAIEAVCEGIQVPVGGTIGWWSDVLPAAGTWLWLHGDVVSAGAYPVLAAANPGWVSGGNIHLPDTRKQYLMGAAFASDSAHGPAPGTTGGSPNVSLTTAMIPRFSAVPVTLSGLSHSHGGGTGGESNDHTHNFPGTGLAESNASAIGLQAGGSNPALFNFGIVTSGVNVGHSHGISADTISGASGSVTFGNTTPTPVPIQPQFIARHEIVRAA